MTESTRPDEPTASDPAAPRAAPPSSWAASSTGTTAVVPAGRPGTVTAGSIILIVLGALTILFGVLFILLSAVFSGASGADVTGTPGFGGMMDAFAGMLIFIAILVLIFGALQLWVGINALGGKSWSRITGLVLSVIGAALFVGGLVSASSAAESSPVLNIVFIAAYLFVIYAFATGGRWFGRGA